MLGSLLKAALVVVDLPLAVVKDTVTLGGATQGKDRTYTEGAINRFSDNITDVTK